MSDELLVASVSPDCCDRSTGPPANGAHGPVVCDIVCDTDIDCCEFSGGSARPWPAPGTAAPAPATPKPIGGIAPDPGAGNGTGKPSPLPGAGKPIGRMSCVNGLCDEYGVEPVAPDCSDDAPDAVCDATCIAVTAPAAGMPLLPAPLPIPLNPPLPPGSGPASRECVVVCESLDGVSYSCACGLAMWLLCALCCAEPLAPGPANPSGR